MLVKVTRVKVDHYLGWSRQEGPSAGGDVTWGGKERAVGCCPRSPKSQATACGLGQYSSGKYTFHPCV